MDLVDDVDTFFYRGRGVDCLVQNGPDVVHPVVGGGVQLQHVQHGAILDAHAGLAFPAGVAVLRVKAVHRPGQQLGAGGLARAAGAGEQIGVRHAARGHLPLEGLGDMLLPHHIVKGAGSPLAV